MIEIKHDYKWLYDVPADSENLDPPRYISSFFQVVLVVNVASECGYTDGHYKTLVRLQKKLGANDKFTVLAFPCNQFGKQEPGVITNLQWSFEKL